MTREEIIKGSILIEDFLDKEIWMVKKASNEKSVIEIAKIQLNIYEDYLGKGYEYNIDGANYHKDWNLLMRVINKILDIDITPAPNWSGYRVEIVPNGYIEISGFPMTPKICKNVSVEGSPENATFKAIVEFIEYHNKKIQDEKL